MSRNYRIANRNIIPRAHRQKMRAFTLIELMVVVTIISVLASISIIGATSIQRSTRDDARQSQATVVAEALEKYYENNNEYPSVASITNQPINSVKQKLGIKDSEVLTFPTVTAGTSVLVATNPTPARLTYVASTTDSAVNSQCQSDVNGYCDAFRLQYVKELDNNTVTINSRRNATLVIGDPGPIVLSPPTQPAVVGTQVNTSLVRFTVSSASCSIGSVEYKIRYNTSSSNTASMPDWSTVNWSSATTRDINPGSSTRFYSQSLARCVSGSENSADSSPSAVDTLDFTPTPPPGTPPSSPGVSAAGVSTSQIAVSWSPVSGSAPISYTVRYGTSSGSYGTTASGCSGISTTSCTISGLVTNTYYYIQVTAVNAYGSAVGTTAASTMPPSGISPSSPVVSTSAINAVSIQVSWSASSGTAPISYSVSGAGSASSCSASPCTVTGLSPATSYTFTVNASNAYGSSNGSSTVTTQSTALNFTRGVTQTNSNVTLSWNYTNGYSASGNFNVTGTQGTGCTNVTGSYCYLNRTVCTNTPTVTLTGPDGRTASLGLDAVSVPSPAPGWISFPNIYAQGFQVTWGQLTNATFYSLEVRWPGGALERRVAGIQSPTTVSSIAKGSWNVIVAGMNCAGEGASRQASVTIP